MLGGKSTRVLNKTNPRLRNVRKNLQLITNHVNINPLKLGQTSWEMIEDNQTFDVYANGCSYREIKKSLLNHTKQNHYYVIANKIYSNYQIYSSENLVLLLFATRFELI